MQHRRSAVAGVRDVERERVGPEVVGIRDVRDRLRTSTEEGVAARHEARAVHERSVQWGRGHRDRQPEGRGLDVAAGEDDVRARVVLGSTASSPSLATEIGVGVAVGVSFTAVTVTCTVAVALFGANVPFVVPLSVIVYVYVSGPL